MLKAAPWFTLSLTLSPEAAWARITTASKPYGLLGISGKEPLIYKGTTERFSLFPSRWQSSSFYRHGHYWEFTGRITPAIFGCDIGLRLEGSPKRYIGAIFFAMTLAIFVIHYALLGRDKSLEDWLISDGMVPLIFLPLFASGLPFSTRRESRRQHKLLLDTLDGVFADVQLRECPSVRDFFQE